jgi:hypothetical protein
MDGRCDKKLTLLLLMLRRLAAAAIGREDIAVQVMCLRLLRREIATDGNDHGTIYVTMRKAAPSSTPL